MRRAKIWELSAHLHCSIVGTCLTAHELRQFLVRRGDADARTAGDHALHGRGVAAAARGDLAGKLLNKTLDKRHEAAIRRFAKAHAPASLREMWTQALDQGEISGPYWALLTHPATDARLAQDVFGDVHMLSHQVGAAARLDIARLRRLEADRAERDEKIARQQERLAAAARERVALRASIESLQARLVAAAPAPAPEPPRRHPADESARAASLAERLRSSEAERAQAEAGRREALAEARLLRMELNALEAALKPANSSDEPAEIASALNGVRILYVGGRPKLTDQLRAFVGASGGSLIAHDGGLDDSLALLPGLVSQADAVYFPVDCVSHSAAEKVKRLCQRLGKPWAPLRSASLASFIVDIARSPRQAGLVLAAE